MNLSIGRRGLVAGTAGGALVSSL
ncbi:MAG: hypothetical protein RIR65_1020, partial [Planctomycetota bacterium]